MIEVLRRAVRWRWLLVLAVLVPAAVVGVALVRSQPPTFHSVAVVGLAPESVDVSNPDLVQLSVDRYAVLLSSNPTLRTVSEETGVPVADLRAGVQVGVTAESANLQINATLDDLDDALAVANALAAQAGLLADADAYASASVLSPATIEDPSLAQDPRVLEVLVVLAALLAGLALASLVEVWRPRVRTAGDAEALAGAPVVGSLPRFSRRGGVDEAEVLRAARLLRAGFVARARRTPTAATALVGAEAGAGCTTAGFLLARACADAGERVLVVDADLEKARLSAQLGLHDAPGLLEVLDGQVPLAKAAVAEGGVDVLPVRPEPGGGDLLERGLGEVVREAGDGWDRVLLDASPLVGARSGEGGQVAAGRAGSALLVVSLHSRASEVRRAARTLDRLGIPIRGVVLNRASRRPAESALTSPATGPAAADV